MDKERFVFRDPAGSRWRRFSRLALVVGLVLAVGIGLFVRSLYVLPKLEPLPAGGPDTDIKADSAPTIQSTPAPPTAWVKQSKRRGGGNGPGAKPAFVRLGFLDDDVEPALASFRANADQLTHVAPLWLRLTGMPPKIEQVPETDTAELTDLAAKHNVALMPILANLLGERFDPEAVEHFLRAKPEVQDSFAEDLIARLQGFGARGVVITWEQVDPTYRDELTAFVARLHGALKTAGLELWLTTPVGNDINQFDLDALSPHVDRFVAELYYETGETDLPGPLASLDWFQEWLDALMAHGESNQWVIGIGTFGYDWGQKGRKPEQIAFYDAMARATSARLDEISATRPHDGPRFSYRVGNATHTLWFLDGATFFNQQKLALAKNPGGIAIDRLGTEDPHIWRIMRCGSACKPGDFQEIPAQDVIAAVGTGDFLRVSRDRQAGRRTLTAGGDGFWEERYTKLPRTVTIEHRGGDQRGKVALTFDDGPSPDWTPQVLDILRDKGAKATFFITGQNAVNHPRLIRRILEEGHDLGNHTYDHANLAVLSPSRVRLELNMTQRAIENITGRSTLLFRPPYDADTNPHNLAEIEPLLIAQELGYITAMASIDPLDWEEPTADQLFDRIRKQRLEGGKVVLLHDAGGDRSHTIEALPRVIDHLRARGDELVTLSNLLGVPQDRLMPSIPADDPVQDRVVAGTGLSLLQMAKDVAWNFLLVSTGLLLLRTLLIVALAMRRARQEQLAPPPEADFYPPLSVVLAAYNEEKVIGHTLEALLASRYDGPLEIVVVNDGSTDATARVVEEWAQRDGRVVLVSQPNSGKAQALKLGLFESRHPFVAMLDADTLFEPDTLRELVAPLRDPAVGATSGHILVGNRTRAIARFQALEYIAGFNLDRRAYDRLDIITVVPGAASAYRREAIEAAGGIQTDTLAEDTDLTLSMHKAGYVIRHTSRARAVTEAPETFRALLRQRKRWSFGTLQCLWKHRDMLFWKAQPWMGYFALPSIWFFHIFMVALVPIVDFTVIAGLFSGVHSSLVLYSLAFLGIDLLLALAACRLEGERLSTALLVIPMRLVYRPLLSIAVIHSLLRALRGRWVGWGVQERWGLVQRWSKRISS